MGHGRRPRWRAYDNSGAFGSLSDQRSARRHLPLSNIRTREFGVGPEMQSIFELNCCNDTPIKDLRRIIKF